MSKKALALLSSDQQFNKTGHILLFCGLCFALIFVLLLNWQAPEYIILPLLVLSTSIVAGLVFRNDLITLCLTILGTFFILFKNATVASFLELAFHMYLLGYIGYWFTSRFLFYKDTVLKDAADWCLFIYLLYTTASFFLTVVFKGSVSNGFSEWVPLTVLALYFPIKEACYRHKKGAIYIISSFCVLTLIMVLLNFHEYYSDLAASSYLYQITNERVRSNELLIMTSFILIIVLFINAPSKKLKLLTAIVLSPFLAGIIITQSRSLWVATALGCSVVFIFAKNKQRRELLILLAWGILLILLAGIFFLQDYFFLILSGFLERFTSLQTATTKDISLINRFSEWKAAWESIKLSPIIGRGFGVPFHFFDLTREVTMVKSHIHSVYIGVLYRHGLIGLSLIGTFYFLCIRKAFLLIRMRNVSLLDSLIATGSLACLIATLLPASTESLLLVDPGTITIAFITSVVTGRWHRHHALNQTSPSLSY